MSNIYRGAIGLIGHTPLVEIANIEKELGLEATVLVKLEYLNPAGILTFFPITQTHFDGLASLEIFNNNSVFHIYASYPIKSITSFNVLSSIFR